MLTLTHEHQGTAVAWYALVNYFPDSHQLVYQAIDSHQVEPIYLNTALEKIQDESPLLIALKYGGSEPLTEQLPLQQTLFFSAPAALPFETIAEQLRWRMLIGYHGERKGVFHYYTPEVASYFFTDSSARSTSAWLGAFYSVGFYSQKHSEAQQWREVGDYTSAPDLSMWMLLPDQEQALYLMNEEREIREWAKESEIGPINWPAQQAVNQFTEHHNIQDDILIVRLRQLAQQNGQLPQVAAADQLFFSHLSAEEKIIHLEQIVLRRVHHGV
ncbi:hypothetical protein VA7868_03654 [Vibrio aerogenes CECT 7868]|uniref:DUF4123 domain-containing protein n=1 Tax=Vibrio aerogenes CECT 7868 TaxID=1216006 RepID=A0A1M6ASC0_9VIBR|nr:DUF4123 domain-containing protein [Vibrio aerogenes]SHI39362.1 hypothetical protein VA7868_03654 [Vibrio aerogenes CECT 7868]